MKFIGRKGLPAPLQSIWPVAGRLADGSARGRDFKDCLLNLRGWDVLGLITQVPSVEFRQQGRKKPRKYPSLTASFGEILTPPSFALFFIPKPLDRSTKIVYT